MEGSSPSGMLSGLVVARPCVRVQMDQAEGWPGHQRPCLWPPGEDVLPRAAGSAGVSQLERHCRGSEPVAANEVVDGECLAGPGVAWAPDERRVRFTDGPVLCSVRSVPEWEPASHLLPGPVTLCSHTLSLAAQCPRASSSGVPAAGAGNKPHCVFLLASPSRVLTPWETHR